LYQQAAPQRAMACVLISAMLLSSGCLRHARTPLASDLRPPASARMRFAAWRGSELPEAAPQIEALRAKTSRHLRFAIRMPAVTDNNQAGRLVTATYFATTARSPRPLVVVLPIWGSSTFPPRKIVGRLIRERTGHRVNVLWVHGDQRLINWPAAAAVDSEQSLAAVVDHWVAAIAGTVVDVRRLIAWAHTRPEVAHNQVAVVGFSIGAIVGALVAGTEPRVAGGVLVAGGTNLHQILASCRGNTLRFRTLVEERLGWSAAKLERWLEPRLGPINPAHYGDNIDPRAMLIIDAQRDKCIPQSARDDLWLAMGRPERLSLAYGHRMSFLSMTFLGLHFTNREIVDFLDRTLLAADDPGRVTPARRERIQAVVGGPGRRP